MKDHKPTEQEMNEITKEVLGDPEEPTEAYTSPSADPHEVWQVNYPEEIPHLVSRVIKSLGFVIEELETLNDPNEFVVQWRGKVEGIPVSGAYRTTGDEKYQALAIAFSFAMNMHPGSTHFLWMADAMQYQIKNEPNSSGHLVMRKIISEMNAGSNILLRIGARYDVRRMNNVLRIIKKAQKKER